MAFLLCVSHNLLIFAKGNSQIYDIINNVMKKAISTNAAPAAIGPYSQAIEVGNLVFTSGQLLNIQSILKAAGLTMGDVVKTTVFMADMADFADMNAVYAEFFSEPYPARSAVAVKMLPKGAMLEIEVVAERR